MEGVLAGILDVSLTMVVLVMGAYFVDYVVYRGE